MTSKLEHKPKETPVLSESEESDSSDSDIKYAVKKLPRGRRERALAERRKRKERKNIATDSESGENSDEPHKKMAKAETKSKAELQKETLESHI